MFQGPTFVAGLLHDPISEVESSEPSIEKIGGIAWVFSGDVFTGRVLPVVF